MGIVVPIAYRIDRARRVVFTTAHGLLTEEEYVAHVRRLRSDPDFDPTFDQLVDLGEVSDMTIRLATLRASAHASAFSRQARRAFVVRADVVVGMIRFYQISAGLEDGPLKLFRELEEARRWLGLD